MKFSSTLVSVADYTCKHPSPDSNGTVLCADVGRIFIQSILPSVLLTKAHLIDMYACESQAYHETESAALSWLKTH